MQRKRGRRESVKRRKEERNYERKVGAITCCNMQKRREFANNRQKNELGFVKRRRKSQRNGPNISEV